MTLLVAVSAIVSIITPMGSPSGFAQSPEAAEPPTAARDEPSASDDTGPQDSATSGSGRAFKIGFLESGSDLAPARHLAAGLRDALGADGAASDAMADAGYTQISLRPCDDPADLLQRLRAGEFELAFATAVVYSRLFQGGAEIPGGPGRSGDVAYEPVLQFFRSESDVRNPRGEGVMRQGVIFVRRNGPLAGREFSADDLRAEFERHSLAVSDSNSAAGYIFPLVEIQDRFGQMRSQAPIFCGSEDEVVKHVVSGLAEIGACSPETLARIGSVRASGEAYKLYEELFRTDLFPTDPILLRADLLPRRSALGIELKAALRVYFMQSPPPAPGLGVVKAERRSYELMSRALDRFDRLNRELPDSGESNELDSTDAAGDAITGADAAHVADDTGLTDVGGEEPGRDDARPVFKSALPGAIDIAPPPPEVAE